MRMFKKEFRYWKKECVVRWFRRKDVLRVEFVIDDYVFVGDLKFVKRLEKELVEVDGGRE